MINEKNIIERNKEKKKEESKMKETCKIKHSTSDISEYYCYSIGKDLDGLLEKCIQFPKSYLTPLRDQSEIAFTAKYRNITSYQALPDIESPFMRFEEIQEKTKNAVFLGFGHTILPSKKGEQTDVFYLFFKEKNTFFEVVFVSDWIKKEISLFGTSDKNLDHDSIYFFRETDSIHDLSIEDVDVIQMADPDKIDILPVRKITDISWSSWSGSVLILFEDGSCAPFEQDRTVPKDSMISFCFSNHDVSNISVDFFFFEKEICRKDLLDVERYDVNDAEKERGQYRLTVYLDYCLKSYSILPERICVILRKHDLNVFGRVDWSIEENLPFANSCYLDVRKEQEEKEEDQCFLFELIKLGNGYKVRNHYESDYFLKEIL